MQKFKVGDWVRVKPDGIRVGRVCAKHGSRYDVTFPRVAVLSFTAGELEPYDADAELNQDMLDTLRHIKGE